MVESKAEKVLKKKKKKQTERLLAFEKMSISDSKQGLISNSSSDKREI